MKASRQTLWYNRPAANWFEALPVGNGRLGGMIYGGIDRERIALNEDTLWSGEPRETVRFDALRHLQPVREMIFAGRYAEAEETIERYMEGPDIESYLPLGDLELIFEDGGAADMAEYRRELDLDEGLVRVNYRQDEAAHSREMFVSAADQVMAIRLTADRGISFTALLHSPLQHAVRRLGGGRIELAGRCPVHVLPNTVKSPEPIQYAEGRGIGFAVQLQAIAEGGRLESSGGRLRVSSARSVTLLLAAATSFSGFERDPAVYGRDASALCGERLAAAASLGYDALKRRHADDYAALFGSVALELGGEDRSVLPTDARIEAVKRGEDDPGLAALFFQFGRYLLIASSRPDSQPANLQGIWNDRMQPPWCSSWTTNINLQMNYWPAEVANLAECHRPLFRLIEDLRITGQKAAAVHYGCRGWTAHHNIDLWRTATPVGGSPSWAFWPMAGAWLCEHLWEHYAFGQDEAFLETAYPAIREAALFCLDWLVEAPDGTLVTCPSTSPENTFIAPDGQRSSVSKGSTMDMALIRNVFARCIEAATILNLDPAFREELAQALERIAPYRIGRHGQLQEWDEDFEEQEPGHRHTAHLVALHPLDHISPRREPELAAACRKTLERRLSHGGAHTGWSCAWTVCFWARLGEPEEAARFLGKLLGGLHPNMTNAHRHPKVKLNIFQIDGNMAGVAGMAELLLQSHAGEIALLPALPSQWPKGRVRGLRARGGFEIAMEWSEGTLLSASIVSRAGKRCRLRTAAPVRVLAEDGTAIRAAREAADTIAFATEAGRVYKIEPAAASGRGQDGARPEHGVHLELGGDIA